MSKIFIYNGYSKNTNVSHPEALQVLLLNLMPNRAETELQFISLLKQSQRDIALTFCLPNTHNLKNNAAESLEKYSTFNEIHENYYDALIVTGAPLDRLDFSAVDFWNEFTEILTWRKTHVSQSLFVCWGAYAAGKIDGIFEGKQLIQKISGVFTTNNLTIPHSRYFIIPMSNSIDGDVIAGNDEIGAALIINKELNSTYLTGHLEYQTETLAQEYQRDVAAKLNPPKPKNYFNTQNQPINTWKKTAITLYQQWINNVTILQTSSVSGKE